MITLCSMQDACIWMVRNNKGMRMRKKGEGYFELVSKYPIEKLVFPAGWYYTSAEGFTSPILSELSTFGYCQIIVRPGILQKVKSFLE